MSIVFICGSHPRHAYIARALAATGRLSHLIIETREEHTPEPPSTLTVDQKKLFRHHFNEREKVEKLFFGECVWPDTKVIEISKDDLDNSEVRQVITEYASDLLLSYGCHKLSDKTLSYAPKYRWNCHGGLSPWYKGAITHFWPSYMLEPQMTGMTVHELTSKLDGGDVIHQCIAPLIRGDSLHQLAARAVIELAQELPKLVDLISKGHIIPTKSHVTSGMIWRASQWSPNHLDVIYNHYNDKIVDLYLDGKLTNSKPELFRQF